MYEPLKPTLESIVNSLMKSFVVTLFLMLLCNTVFGQIDPKATTETKALYENLKSIALKAHCLDIKMLWRMV